MSDFVKMAEERTAQSVDTNFGESVDDSRNKAEFVKMAEERTAQSVDTNFLGSYQTFSKSGSSSGSGSRRRTTSSSDSEKAEFVKMAEERTAQSVQPTADEPIKTSTSTDESLTARERFVQAQESPFVTGDLGQSIDTRAITDREILKVKRDGQVVGVTNLRTRESIAGAFNERLIDIAESKRQFSSTQQRLAQQRFEDQTLPEGIIGQTTISANKPFSERLREKPLATLRERFITRPTESLLSSSRETQSRGVTNLRSLGIVAGASATMFSLGVFKGVAGEVAIASYPLAKKVLPFKTAQLESQFLMGVLATSEGRRKTARTLRSGIATSFSKSPESFFGEITTGIGTVATGSRLVSKELGFLKSSLRASKAEKKLAGSIITRDNQRFLEELVTDPSIEIKARPLERLRIASEEVGSETVLSQRMLISPEFGESRLVTGKDLTSADDYFKAQFTFVSERARTPRVTDTSTTLPEELFNKVTFEKSGIGLGQASEIPTENILTTRTIDVKPRDVNIIRRTVGEVKFEAVEVPTATAEFGFERLTSQQKKLYPIGIEYKGGIPFAETKQLGFIRDSDLLTVSVEQGGRARRFTIDPRNQFIVREQAIAPDSSRVNPLLLQSIKAKRRSNIRTFRDIVNEPDVGGKVTSGGSGQQTILRTETKQESLFAKKTKKKSQSSRFKQSFATLAKTFNQQQSSFAFATSDRPLFAQGSRQFDSLRKATSKKSKLAESLAKATTSPRLVKIPTFSLGDSFVGSLTKTDTLAKTDSLVKTDVLTKTKAKVSTDSLTKSDTALKSDLSKLIKTPEVIKSRKTDTVPRKLRFDLDLKRKQPKPKKVQAYNAYAFEKGKPVKVNNKPLSREQAINTSLEAVDNTASATGFIKKAGASKINDPQVKINQALKNKFQVGQKKRSNAPVKYTEKNQNRIDTLGELQGITVKGWASRRKNSLLRF